MPIGPSTSAATSERAKAPSCETSARRRTSPSAIATPRRPASSCFAAESSPGRRSPLSWTHGAPRPGRVACGWYPSTARKAGVRDDPARCPTCGSARHPLGGALGAGPDGGAAPRGPYPHLGVSADPPATSPTLAEQSGSRRAFPSDEPSRLGGDHDAGSGCCFRAKATSWGLGRSRAATAAPDDRCRLHGALIGLPPPETTRPRYRTRGLRRASGRSTDVDPAVASDRVRVRPSRRHRAKAAYLSPPVTGRNRFPWLSHWPTRHAHQVGMERLGSAALWVIADERRGSADAAVGRTASCYT
jgi:hypothetical protein